MHSWCLIFVLTASMNRQPVHEFQTMVEFKNAQWNKGYNDKQKEQKYHLMITNTSIPLEETRQIKVFTELKSHIFYYL